VIHEWLRPTEDPAMHLFGSQLIQFTTVTAFWRNAALRGSLQPAAANEARCGRVHSARRSSIGRSDDAAIVVAGAAELRRWLRASTDLRRGLQ
jgi:hypothetical protein